MKSAEKKKKKKTIHIRSANHLTQAPSECSFRIQCQAMRSITICCYCILWIPVVDLLIFESPPRRNHCAAFGGYSSTVVQKEISRKKKFFYTVTFVAGCVHLFSPKPPAFSKKKSTTCSSSLFFQFPAGTLISLVVFVCTPFRSRVQQLLLSLSYLSSCLSFTNRCATNPSVYFVCLFLVFRDLFVFTQFTQC
jgi:hypothetical protein